MDNNEAQAILAQYLSNYRNRSYADLVSMIGQIDVAETAGPSGAKYQIEVEVHWDDKAHRNIRVLGGIDDGGWRAWAPLSQSFIMDPDGSIDRE